MNCNDCIHSGVCAMRRAPHNVLAFDSDFDKGNMEHECFYFCDHSRFLKLPFEQNKGASIFDKVAHTIYTLATEGHRLARNTIEGYYVMYNEDRLYTLEKDGIVILVQGSSPHDVVEKAKLAIEKLSKERESNA